MAMFIAGFAVGGLVIGSLIGFVTAYKITSGQFNHLLEKYGK